VEPARAATKLSRDRPDTGVTTYLEVLDIERSLFGAEMQATRALQEQLSAVVSLTKALAGGWQAEEEKPPVARDR
jgi:multidrug efflux system outer membrane protein